MIDITWTNKQWQGFTIWEDWHGSYIDIHLIEIGPSIITGMFIHIENQKVYSTDKRYPPFSGN